MVGIFKKLFKKEKITKKYKDGTTYVGEMKNGVAHGQGTWTAPGVEKYVGEWKNEKRHGKGIYTWADGTVEKGIWENGKLVETN